jgi:hypothetical protein
MRCIVYTQIARTYMRGHRGTDLREVEAEDALLDNLLLQQAEHGRGHAVRAAFEFASIGEQTDTHGHTYMHASVHT